MRKITEKGIYMIKIGLFLGNAKLENNRTVLAPNPQFYIRKIIFLK